MAFVILDSSTTAVRATSSVLICLYGILLLLECGLMGRMIHEKTRFSLGVKCMLLQALMCIFRIVSYIPSTGAVTSKDMQLFCQYITSWADMCELWSVCILGFAWLKVIRVFYAKRKYGNTYKPDNARVVNFVMFTLLGVTFLGQFAYTAGYWLYYKGSDKISVYGYGYILYYFICILVFGFLLLSFGVVLMFKLKNDSERQALYASKITKIISIIGACIVPFLVGICWLLVTKGISNVWTIYSIIITLSVSEFSVALCYMYFFGWRYFRSPCIVKIEPPERSTSTDLSDDSVVMIH